MAKWQWEDESPEVQEIEQPKQSSFLGQIGRPVARAIESAGGFLGNIQKGIQSNFEPMEQYLKEKTGVSPIKIKPLINLPTSEDIREQTTKFLEKHIGPGSSTAKNVPEKIIDAIASTIPFALATGGIGSIPSSALSAAAGNLASQGAEALGFGQFGQAVADIFGSTGFNLLKKGGSPRQFRNLAKKKSEDLYKQAEEIGSKTKISQEIIPARKFINEEIKTLRSGSSRLAKADSKRILDEFYDVERNLNRESVTLNRVWDKKKHLNRLLEKEEDTIARAFYKRAVGSLNDILKRGESSSKSGFAKFYNPAESLHIGLEAPSKIRHYLEKYTNPRELNPLLQGLIGSGIGGSLYFSPATTLTKAAVGIPALYGARGVARMVDLMRRPEAQKLYAEIASSALENNKAATLKAVYEFNKVANDYNKDNPEEKPQWEWVD
jgi:hypothetical protein